MKKRKKNPPALRWLHSNRGKKRTHHAVFSPAKGKEKKGGKGKWRVPVNLEKGKGKKKGKNLENQPLDPLKPPEKKVKQMKSGNIFWTRFECIEREEKKSLTVYS